MRGLIEETDARLRFWEGWDGVRSTFLSFGMGRGGGIKGEEDGMVMWAFDRRVR